MAEDEREKADSDRIDQATEWAQRFAGAVDNGLGREDAPDPLAKLKDIEAAKLVPRKVQESPKFKLINKSIGTASAGFVLVALVVGNGTLSAVVAGISSAYKGSTTVGSYLQFADAFLVTLALSASTALLTYLAASENLKGYGAVSVWILSTLAIVGVVHSLGFNGPTVTDMLDSMNAANSNPIAQGGALFAGFLQHYTILPFLNGLIAGGTTGWLVFKLEQDTPAA